jgi:ABC-2 type transport system ATP-binding protein
MCFSRIRTNIKTSPPPNTITITTLSAAPMQTAALVELSGIKKTYPGAARPALNGIDLAIRKGSIVGLLGPNGAGKTTLMSILCGLLTADAGTLNYQWNARETKYRIGWVPQDLAIYPSLTAEENMQFFGSMYLLRGPALRQRIEACLAVSGLQTHGRQRCETFSGGMKRRLNLAIAILHEPALLVLDEPTVGVDAQSRRLIHDTLRALHAQGTTIVYSTHYMEEAQELCRDLAIIDHGNIVAQGELDALLRQHGESSVAIETEAIPLPALLDKLRQQPGVARLAAEGKRIVINGDAPQALLAGALNVLARENMGVTGAHFGRIALEDIFLHLTGTTLRD